MLRSMSPKALGLTVHATAKISVLFKISVLYVSCIGGNAGTGLARKEA